MHFLCKTRERKREMIINSDFDFSEKEKTPYSKI